MLIWLFGAQGTKENIPTFGMTLVEEGQYAVDFHAKLSPLQAFSISVAILHGTSAFSPTTRQAKNQQLSQCNSPNTLIEEEVELFIKSVTTEEKKAVSNIPKGLPRSCIPKPPFSPIARVWTVVYTSLIRDWAAATRAKNVDCFSSFCQLWVHNVCHWLLVHTSEYSILLDRMPSSSTHGENVECLLVMPGSN